MPIEHHAIHNQDTAVLQPTRFKRNRSAVGVALILFGIIFALKQVGLIEVTWPLILMTIGFISLAGAWLTRSTEGVLPGIFLLLLGLIFLADGKQWIEGGGAQNWPLVVVALGLSFIGSALIDHNRRKQWSSSLILVVSGVFLLVVEYGWITWGVLNEVLAWWPVLPIIAGIWFLLRRRSTYGKSKLDKPVS